MGAGRKRLLQFNVSGRDVWSSSASQRTSAGQVLCSGWESWTGATRGEERGPVETEKPLRLPGTTAVTVASVQCGPNRHYYGNDSGPPPVSVRTGKEEKGKRKPLVLRCG